MIKITECPRDAMQGIHQLIPTELKAKYINQLLKVGFEKIDFGSFVSPKAIPQMHDTAAVLELLNLSETRSKLLAIIANARGAEDACQFEQIHYLGFPFSISETFQQRNTNSSISESLQRVEAIQNLCQKNNKELLVYISMAFGNPYGDDWSAEIAINWGHQLSAMGIKHLALADTTGSSTPATITQLFSNLLPALKGVELSAHLHSVPHEAREKIAAAYVAGCRKFDVAVHGFGGCPMASDALTGNISTQALESYAIEQKVDLQLNAEALHTSYDMSWEIFNHYH